MIQPDISKIFSYVVAVVFAGLGLAFIFKIIDLNLQPGMRYMFGAIFILMGIYRLVINQAKSGSSRRKIFDEDE
jgi:sulfite exporter TauE/SafE